METSRGTEDYLEAIYRLESKTGGRTHTTEIARELDVSLPSVTQMLHRLSEEKLIEYEPYYGAKLTEDGKAIATRVDGAHQTLEEFFEKILGLPRETADSEACKVEHCLGPETIEKMRSLLEKMKSCHIRDHTKE